MKLSDGPVPNGVPHKTGISLDLVGFKIGSVIDLPADVMNKAARYVASSAADAADARDLLEHLDLIAPHTPTPAWKRANKPKAAP